MNKNRKILGFTLIEMLVVVGIIAVLSVVALTSLGPAREKSRDAKIVADVNQVRAVAENFFNENNVFTGFSTSTLLDPIRNSIQQNGGSLQVFSQNLRYCAKSRLLSNNSLFYCVDSNGFAGYITSTNNCISINNISCR